jgi:hypothetical protein
LPADVKPSICNREFCNFQDSQLGVGTNVIQDIKRDPFAADRLLSVFSAAVGASF